MSIKVLFVDDESRVLQGLQRRLRLMRQEWCMEFAKSGEQALKILEDQPFDVVVTDMRMPGMDGATLLGEVMMRYPQVLRVVLSGQSDLESIIRSAGVTHQYLSKPCTTEMLKATVDRAFALRQLLTDTALKECVSRMTAIPSVPPLYTELMRLFQSPSVSMDKVEQIVSKDMGMTAKILQLANSAFSGPTRNFADPVRAVSYLGLNSLKTLLFSVNIFYHFSHCYLPAFSIYKMWKHSLLVSKLAEKISKSVTTNQNGLDDTTRVAGLLHDVGQLVLVANLPLDYANVAKVQAEKGIPDWVAEQEILGTTHSEVGAYLLGLWGLPDPIVEATAYHHFPNHCPSHTFFTPLTAIHIADGLEKETRTGDGNAPNGGIDIEYLTKVGVTQRLPEWRMLCQRVLKEAGEYDRKNSIC